MRTSIRTATLTGYAGLARSVGLDPELLMARAGLDIIDLDIPDKWIPAASAAWLLETSAQLSGCADFALRLAGLRRLGTLGPLSVVLRDEPDLRRAVDLLIRYERAYNEALHLRLVEAEGVARLEVWLEFGEPAPSAQASDLVMGALIGIIRALIRSDWDPLSALFAHEAPADAAPYRRMFGAHVRFGQAVTGMVFPARDLEAPIASSDASVRPYTQQFLHAVIAPRAATATAQVGEVLEALLPLGRCSLEDVSRHLGISPRLLQRLLAGEGSSFSAVLHVTRARLAERYLSLDRYALTEVSLMLGFAAPSAFSRWFRQQFGTSPTQWRARTRPRVPHLEVRLPDGETAEGALDVPLVPAPRGADVQAPAE